MTFKELRTQLSKVRTPQDLPHLTERLRNRPFWIWDQNEHKQEDVKTRGDCCLNHIIGLPVKRSLKNPKFILLDEADFFRKGEQENARHASERYVGKSDPYIIMVSTPNLPGGLFEQIENEERSRYHRIFLPYAKGMGQIYTPEEIEEARLSPGFEREYNLQYGFGIGNVFLPDQIEKALELLVKLGIDIDIDNWRTWENPVTMGIDPGFGSSNFAICIISLIKESLIHMLYSQEFEKADVNEMLDMCDSLRSKYRPVKIFVDDANPEFIRAFKAHMTIVFQFNRIMPTLGTLYLIIL